MIILKRSVKLNDKEHHFWLGVSQNKGGRIVTFNVHYYPADPDTMPSPPILIKNKFPSMDEAIEYGKDYMKNLYRNIAERKDN